MPAPWDFLFVAAVVLAAAVYLVLRLRRGKGACGGCETARRGCGDPSSSARPQPEPPVSPLIQIDTRTARRSEDP